VAGCLSANRSLPARRGRSIFAAQSNLAFLGMWRCSNRPDLAELLPLDADAAEVGLSLLSLAPHIDSSFVIYSARKRRPSSRFDSISSPPQRETLGEEG
jgi:hypothetical protein